MRVAPSRAVCTAAFGGQRGLDLGEALVGMAQKDQAQHGRGKFGGFEAGIGPELVSGSPKAVFDRNEIRCHGVPVNVGGDGSGW